MSLRIIIMMLLVTSISTAQDVERILLDGQVNVPPGDDPSGITVFNTATGQGTVTQNDGQYNIMAGVGDRLQFSALQYEPFVVEVSSTIIEAGALNVFVSANITELPEVVVGTPDLSGNIEVDVRRIPTEVPELPAESAAEINEFEWEFRPDPQTSPRNVAMEEHGLEHGLNFANLFRSVYNSFVPEGRDSAAVEQSLRELYDDTFFQENLNIPRQDIHDFLLFAREQGLGQELMQEGRELDLIEFLIQASREYKDRGLE